MLNCRTINFLFILIHVAIKPLGNKTSFSTLYFDEDIISIKGIPKSGTISYKYLPAANLLAIPLLFDVET